jgi:hypothetical protein
VHPARSFPARFAPAALAAFAVACTLQANGLSASGEIAPGRIDAGATPSSHDDAAAGSDPEPQDAAIADDSAAPTDASTTSDAPVSVTPDASSADGGSPCDMDGDGHRAKGGVCNGDDCCDLDPHAFAGQTSFFPTPDACGSFDYDCDGKESPEFDVVNCKLGFFSCNGDGFKSSASCGAAAAFEACNFAWTTCSQQESLKTQGCR